ncbi:MAG: heparinase II/III family protein [Edaphobacter sp.]|uniref:heparinase II/III domain-containing protein n=1 Tax=Edaphobacter sp. TaxID=1934404 RepID=UPI00238ED375|nr:heparinase II/III family protein [Edaphobacter sp.]MDE1178657.1 heparinase II/III family protein [Edaphobacter sp.]
MNRRELLRGTAALAGISHLSPLASIAQSQATASAVTKPSDHFLATTFSEQLLRSHLVPIGQWSPYPKVTDRDAWLKVPADLRALMVKNAGQWVGKPWPQLEAVTALDFKRNGNRTRFEELSFGRRVRLVDLVLGECAEGKGRFLDEIANGIWLICEETFWGVPAHLGAQKAGVGLPDVTEPIVDLFAAETSASLSWTHYLLADQLAQVSPLVPQRIRVETRRRILDPLLHRNDFSWMGLQDDPVHSDKWIDFGAKVVYPKRVPLNNWNTWINSNWLVTIMLLEDDADRRMQSLMKSCRSLDQYLHDYSPDGGCEEGPVYWQKSPGAYFDCCRTLSSAVSGAADVMTNPFMQRMGQYIADVHIADNAYVNYGDAHMEDVAPAELIYRYGVAANVPSLMAFGAYNSSKHGLGATGDEKAMEEVLGPRRLPSLARSLPDVLFTNKIRAAKKEDALGRDAWYPHLHLMTARLKQGSVDGCYLAVQAASNGRSHGHNDSGSFIVFHDGEPAIIDPGVEAYTAKTFSPQRYTIWTMQSAYHNLPTIGGVMQHEGRPYAASDITYSTGDDAARIAMNLATAYPPEAGATRWMREIVLDRKANAVRLHEQFKLAKPTSIALSFMTPRTPSESNGAVTLHSAKPGVKDVAIRFDAKALAFKSERIELEDASLRRSWGPALYRVLLTSTAPVAEGDWRFEIG